MRPDLDGHKGPYQHCRSEHDNLGDEHEPGVIAQPDHRLPPKGRERGEKVQAVADEEGDDADEGQKGRQADDGVDQVFDGALKGFRRVRDVDRLAEEFNDRVDEERQHHGGNDEPGHDRSNLGDRRTGSADADGPDREVGQKAVADGRAEEHDPPDPPTTLDPEDGDREADSRGEDGGGEDRVLNDRGGDLVDQDQDLRDEARENHEADDAARDGRGAEVPAQPQVGEQEE